MINKNFNGGTGYFADNAADNNSVNSQKLKALGISPEKTDGLTEPQKAALVVEAEKAKRNNAIGANINDWLERNKVLENLQAGKSIWETLFGGGSGSGSGSDFIIDDSGNMNPQSEDKTGLFVGIGLGVVAIITIAYFAMKGKGKNGK